MSESPENILEKNRKLISEEFAKKLGRQLTDSEQAALRRLSSAFLEGVIQRTLNKAADAAAAERLIRAIERMQPGTPDEC
jgi:hypothetical protein